MSVSAPYVRPQAGEPDAWAQEAAQHGQAGTQLLREVAEIEPPAHIAAALGIQPGETVIVRRRTMLLDGQPVELTDSYYPADIARGTRLAEPRKVPGGAVRLLTELGHTPGHADEDVSAREPTDRERQMLHLPAGEWVLVLFRVLKSDAGRPIEASMMTMLARGRHLRYALSL
ncbi:GntR family transcriptional regulator [Nonomuraea rhodomycinica]|uniref:GntR family transcriptional regulator n=1 Tax=Nonomuraea rhodomycinica TaxID=1712872 RepID=UPI0028B12BCA|nr:UTRA domain-containing protein [Nonomuraea rhodomycinica]